MDFSLKTKQSILVVDDHTEIRTFLRIALEQAGYKIREACNGKEAMEVIRDAACDAVLTDILMPDGDGTQLLMDLQKQSPDTAIIVMTGGSGARDDSLIVKGLGARYILSKPFSNDELVMTIRAALAEKKR